MREIVRKTKIVGGKYEETVFEIEGKKKRRKELKREMG